MAVVFRGIIRVDLLSHWFRVRAPARSFSVYNKQVGSDAPREGVIIRAPAR